MKKREKKLVHPLIFTFQNKIFIAALLAVFLSAGCGPSGVQLADLNISQAGKAWSGFLNMSTYANNNAAPFRGNANFRVKTPEAGYRLSAYFWGNDLHVHGSDIRLDLTSTIGTAVARIKESSNRVLILDSNNNVAYFSDNTLAAFFSFDMPLPLSINDISLLLMGRYNDCFFSGDEHGLPQLIGSTPEGNTILRIPDRFRLTGFLILDKTGRPLRWEQENGWLAEFSYSDAVDFPGPYNIRLSNPDGYLLTVNLNLLESVDRPFTKQELSLPLPKGTQLYPI